MGVSTHSFVSLELLVSYLSNMMQETDLEESGQKRTTEKLMYRVMEFFKCSS